MAKLNRIVEHPVFGNTVIGLILLNAVIVGLETYPTIFQPNEALFHLLDKVLLWAFTVELFLRVVAARPWHRFFTDGWNLFDLMVVGAGHLLAGAHFVSVLRVLRVIRVLRAVSVLPSLQRLVAALLRTIPTMGNIMILLGLLFYVFGVLGTFFFAKAAPEYFGSLHQSFLTLFQVVTLESWASGVMRPVMEAVPWAWAYFVVFILFGTFVVFNLFVGVIVNNVQESDQAEKAATPDSDAARLAAEIAELRAMLQEMKGSLPTEKGSK